MLKVKKRRRDLLQIAAQILENTRDGALKTKVMYRANLSFTQINDYIAFLSEHDLLTQITRDGKDVYLITDKGTHFLQIHRELIGMLKKPRLEAKNSLTLPAEC